MTIALIMREQYSGTLLGHGSSLSGVPGSLRVAQGFYIGRNMSSSQFCHGVRDAAILLLLRFYSLEIGDNSLYYERATLKKNKRKDK